MPNGSAGMCAASLKRAPRLVVAQGPRLVNPVLVIESAAKDGMGESGHRVRPRKAGGNKKNSRLSFVEFIMNPYISLT